MQLNVVQVNSALFSHFPKTKRLVAEMSDIGVKAFQRLYVDATDEGFALRNPKTGNVTRWSVADRIVDPQEGETLGWYLLPTPETLHKCPEVEGYCMTLIND